MSEYSGYQRKRVHALGPFASVYEATGPDGTGRYALKIFHPPASSRVRRIYEIEGFLLAAERQQKAFKKDGAVLEILAFGRCPEGAYVVTPWQDRSLEPLVDTLAAKGDLLRGVAELLLNTLEQWGTQTGGWSHRKLKASNVFLTKSGPLQGTTAVLSDPWFLLGVKGDAPRRNDLAAVGAILAQIVRRREVAAWPIEDAPEWKALGRAGKFWLAYVNFLMDPQPASGELTIAEARKRLRAIPKDANPVKTTLIVASLVTVVVVGGVGGFARFGNPQYMPGPLYKLAETLKNPRTRREAPSPLWAPLCRAWDTWLGDLRGNAARLVRTDALWSGPNDPLRAAIRNFIREADRIHPGALVPQAKGETRMAALAVPGVGTPVYDELLLVSTQDRIAVAMNGGQLQEGTPQIQGVNPLANEFEEWPRWKELRELLAKIEARQFTRAAAALAPKLPPVPDPTTGYKRDMARTLKLFNDLSLDTGGTLALSSRWSGIVQVSTEMEASEDRVQKAMPALITGRLVDRGSLADFADSLLGPLEELRLRRRMFLDPQVVQARFLKESVLQQATAPVTVDDFPRWEEELALFSKVPAADDPRQTPAIAQNVQQLPELARDLEADAPEAEPGGPATLSTSSFQNEFQQRTAELAALRAREIVRIDLPKISEETNGLLERFGELQKRVEATLVLLKPETWLAKVAPPFGKFNETKRRWAAWQATFANETADSLRGPSNRQKFRGLRAQERQVKEWINGLEGEEGLAALVVPDLSAFTPETAGALRQLEAARREQTAVAAAAAVQWRNGLPQVAWSAAGTTVREPLEAHREWLAQLPAFATDLDRLAGLLAGGFGWTEGVSEVSARLAPRPGLADLTGKPAESISESRLLGQLQASNDRAALVSAAQSGKLSRMLTAWRRLGAINGWPANAADLDIDGGVVESLRQLVPATVKDDARRAAVLDELGRETRVRWNRAARNSAGNLEQMSAVFERMAKYNIGEEDLEVHARVNLNLWQLKRSDWSEVEIPPLRQRKDDFVRKIRSIPGAMELAPVRQLIEGLNDIVLTVDPNRARTPSPKLANWKEEMTDLGLGLTATWERGGKTVKLDFSVIQPAGDLPPFYLARRPLAVGEFLDLLATRPREEVDAVMAKMPAWATRDTQAKPYGAAVGWRPRIRNDGTYDGLELNSSWYLLNIALVNGLMDDADFRTRYPALVQAMTEVPGPRSPLQQVSPEAAKIIAEKMLGARLPTRREWQATLEVVGKPTAANFRGRNFQELFEGVRDYDKAGQVIPWRPNEGAFRPRVITEGRRSLYVDDGRTSEDRDESRFWFTSVDDGPATKGFVNLTGNVSIFLQDGTGDFYVAGGSVLSPPGIDFTEPQKVEGSGLIGGKGGTETYSDVGIRPAFEAPPGFKERYRFLELVRKQGYLTW